MKTYDPHSYFNPEQGIIKHIDFDLYIDFEAEQIIGRAVYTLAKASQGALDLDNRDLDISAIRSADKKNIPWTVAKTDSFIGQRTTLQLPSDTTAFEIEFKTDKGASALQWLEPSNTAGGVHPFLFSQCQPIHARAIFPCQDSAAVRFSYTARLSVPKALTPVMSAAPGAFETCDEQERAVYSFDMPQPIPSYLFALAVGNLVSEDLGPRTMVYAEPEMLEASVYEFKDSNAMLLAAEELFGPYLWDRFDFIVMPPAFPYGGMENPRLTFLTPTLIAGDRSLVNVLAHELAHSWTGNLVTNATMNDFWLNEGFTVWAERRILEQLEGTDATALSAALGRIGLNAAIKQFGEDSPYTRLETDLTGDNPDEVYSLVPYEKGFLFVVKMEKALGRKDMDAFIRQYIDRFKFVSITTAEFKEFVEEVRPGVLDKIGADKWIHGEGLPSDAPTFESEKLSELQKWAAVWKDGARPSEEKVTSWTSSELQVFMQEMPTELTEDECSDLEKLLNLDNSNNAEIVCSWLVICATSAYEPAFDKIREFLGTVGRMKFLKPLFSALAKGEKTKALAREIFAANTDKYHPIARGGVEKILS